MSTDPVSIHISVETHWAESYATETPPAGSTIPILVRWALCRKAFRDCLSKRVVTDQTGFSWSHLDRILAADPLNSETAERVLRWAECSFTVVPVPMPDTAAITISIRKGMTKAQYIRALMSDPNVGKMFDCKKG